MRRTSLRSLVCLVGFSGCLVSLFFGFSNPVISNETEGRSGKVKELEQQRLAVLATILDLTKKGFKDGLISQEQLHTAKTDLLSAKLDYADTKENRIKACDEAVEEAKEWEKVVQEGAKAHVFSPIDELKAISDLLESQIAREKADDADDED